MDFVDLNIKRLNHVMTLYGMSKDELLARLNNGRKNILYEKDIFTKRIKISLLKKIDDLFKKGLVYYIDPADPIESKEESIFFRKDSFNTELSLGAKQIVNKYEQEKLSFTSLAKLADLEITRKIPLYHISDSPDIVANEVRNYLYPDFSENPKTFLKNLITQFAKYNILVFEFVESHNKTEKANVEGIFLKPNFIVLKYVKPFRREIFTLIHELGHYLLNIEDVDVGDFIPDKSAKGLNQIEKWCNDFAYYFLSGEYAKQIKAIKESTVENDYNHEIINTISAVTHLSGTALYTRLLLDNKILYSDYKMTIDSIQADYLKLEEEKAKQLEIEKQKSKLEGREMRIPQPKPIISPLYKDTLQVALFSGLISEMDFCKRLKVDPSSLEKYLA